MVKISCIDKNSPTLLITNGTVKKVYLEDIALLALCEIFDKGVISELNNLDLMIPYIVPDTITVEEIITNYSNDRVAISKDGNGDYLFGPINDRTAHLALKEFLEGKPVFKCVTLNDLGIFTETFVKTIVSLRDNFAFDNNNKSFVFERLLKHEDYEVEVMETCSEILRAIVTHKYEVLKHISLYRASAKAMTLETGIKNINKIGNDNKIYVSLATANNLMALISSRPQLLTIMGSPPTVIDYIKDKELDIKSTGKSNEKLYVYNIYEKYSSLTDIIDKKALKDIKYLFTELGKRINNAYNALGIIVDPVGVKQ